MAVLAVVLGVAGHVAVSATSVPKDRELALPADYKSWPVFLKEVQKPSLTCPLYAGRTEGVTC